MTSRTFPPWASVPIEECGEPLRDLASFDFALEPVYFKAGLTTSPAMFMREGAARRLAEIQENIAPLKFKIWDAWRPREVQRKLYAANHLAISVSGYVTSFNCPFVP